MQYQKFRLEFLGISMYPTGQFIVKFCIGEFYEKLLKKNSNLLKNLMKILGTLHFIVAGY